jgi:hypothetical protein
LQQNNTVNAPDVLLGLVPETGKLIVDGDEVGPGQRVAHFIQHLGPVAVHNFRHFAADKWKIF